MIKKNSITIVQTFDTDLFKKFVSKVKPEGISAQAKIRQLVYEFIKNNQ